jgi:hypothetical protein
MRRTMKVAIILAGFYEVFCILTVLLTSLSLNSSREPRTIVQSGFFRDPNQVTPSMSCDDVGEFDQTVVPISLRTGLMTSYVEYTPEMFTDFATEVNLTLPNPLYSVFFCLPSVQIQNADSNSNGLANVTRLLEYGCHNRFPFYDIQYVRDQITTSWFNVNFTKLPFEFDDRTFGPMTCLITTHHHAGPHIVTKTCFSSTVGYLHVLQVGQKYKQIIKVYPSDPNETIGQSMDAISVWYTLLEQKVSKNGLVCRQNIVVNQEYLQSLAFTLDGLIIYISIVSVALFFLSVVAKYLLFKGGYLVVHGGAVIPEFQAPSMNLESTLVAYKV